MSGLSSGGTSVVVVVVVSDEVVDPSEVGVVPSDPSVVSVVSVVSVDDDSSGSVEPGSVVAEDVCGAVEDGVLAAGWSSAIVSDVAIVTGELSSASDSPTRTTRPPTASPPITSLTRTSANRSDGLRAIVGQHGRYRCRVPHSVTRRAIDLLGRPVDLVARAAPGASVMMLIYHRVGGRSPSPVDLDTGDFTAQLDHLAESGRVIDLGDAVRLLDGDATIDDDTTDDATTHDAESSGSPRVVLTFDDGTSDWADVVLPELAERGLPATFYVATDFVERGVPFPDAGDPIGWSGLAELASSDLVTIGSHTHTHLTLDDADASTTVDELDRSVELIEDRLGVPCRHFAYPRAVRPSAAAEPIVRRRFDSAVLAGNRVNVAGRADPHRLGRHALTRSDTHTTFARKAEGGARLEGWLRARRDGG